MTTPETTDDNFIVTLGMDEVLNDEVDYVIGNTMCKNDNTTEITQKLDTGIKIILDDLAANEEIEQYAFLHFFYEIYANSLSCCKK
jgi:hypothetical protein